LQHRDFFLQIKTVEGCRQKHFAATLVASLSSFERREACVDKWLDPMVVPNKYQIHVLTCPIFAEAVDQ
jgi:hypothetical protein